LDGHWMHCRVFELWLFGLSWFTVFGSHVGFCIKWLLRVEWWQQTP